MMNGAKIALRMPMKTKRRLSLHSSAGHRSHGEDIPLDQVFPPLLPYKLPSNLSLAVEEISQEAEP